MYLTKPDFIGRISMSLLDILIAENESQIITNVSKEVEDTISTMVGVLYDVAPELLKTSTQRNGYLLGIAKSIGLYLIYQRADDESIPEKVIKNYDDAMNDLEKISNGKKVLSLPPKPKETTEGSGGGDEGVATEGMGLRRMGSQKKRTHQV